MLSNIVYFIVTLGVLVAFHEWGHFWVARRCGVHVQRFSIGFGKPLKSWYDKQGTEYVIAGIPLGGYVKMLDTRNENVAPADLAKTFNAKTSWQKAAIVAAGPVANFVLAFLVYYLVFILGVPGLKSYVGIVQSDGIAAQAGMRSGELIVAVDGVEVSDRADVHQRLVRRIGDTGVLEIRTQAPGIDVNGDIWQGSGVEQRTYRLVLDRWLVGQAEPDIYDSLGFDYWFPRVAPVVDQLVDGGAAEKAGLQVGDEFLEVDGVAVNDWQHFASEIRSRPGEETLLTVKRGDQLLDVKLRIAAVDESGETVGQVGVAVKRSAVPEGLRLTKRSNFFDAAGQAWIKTGEMVSLTVESIVKMIKGLISPRNLSGPITIAQVAGDAAERGLVYYLQILALLSISLGVLNLLPVPMLDGGQLVFIAAEGIMGKPVPMSVQLGAQQLGLLVIFSLMAFAIYNDFSRLF